MFRTTTRFLAASVLLTAAFAASAQTPSQQAAAGGNMAARGERHSFAFGSMRNPTNSSVIDRETVRRPVAQFGPVTPVPEPSEWAMLLVGLTFVGWIVRRKTKQ